MCVCVDGEDVRESEILPVLQQPVLSINALYVSIAIANKKKCMVQHCTGATRPVKDSLSVELNRETERAELV